MLYMLLVFLGTPMLALTGTANVKMGKKIRNLLSMGKDTHNIEISPERSNIKFSVLNVKRDKYHSSFEWIADLIKAEGLSTPKTIVFCNTMTNVAAMVGNLFTMLGKAVYVPGKPELPENKLIGIFHSLTLPKYKKRVMDSFKSNDGSVRVVIATSALSMGVNFPDVQYIVHYGPARTLVDHIQEAGRAGRNGEKAYDVTIFHGQQLAVCEQGVKDFARATSCLRKVMYCQFDPGVESVMPMHDCCGICEIDCKCGGETCTGNTLPFNAKHSDDSAECVTPAFHRDVSTEDREALSCALLGLKEQYDSEGLSVFDPVSTHGFSSSLVEAVVNNSENIATIDYIMDTFPIYSQKHAVAVLEIFNEIFEDIPAMEELMQITENDKEGLLSRTVFYEHELDNYFDEPDLQCFDCEDRVNAEELENL